MSVVKFLTAMGLFIGQPKAFFELLQDLAMEANAPSGVAATIRSTASIRKPFKKHSRKRGRSMNSH
jgi:hypothetical protein